MKYYFVINDFIGNSRMSNFSSLEKMLEVYSLKIELEFSDNYRFTREEIEEIAKRNYLELFL
jgi:hypothetical protein